MKRFIAGIVMLVAAATCARAGSTVNPAIPSEHGDFVSAPVRGNFQATFNDINNILGVFAGPTAPASPTNFQSWADTTTTPNVVFKYWNQRNRVWVAYATLNINTNAFTPSLTSSLSATSPLAVAFLNGAATFSLNTDSSLTVNGSNQLALPAIAGGRVMANTAGGSAQPSGVTGTSWFDSAYCNTVGYLLVRFTGAWTCSNAFPLDITWLGADPTGVSDSAPAIRSAIALSPNVSAPLGSFRLASCVNNAVIDYSPAGIQNHTATLRGVAGSAALAGDGTRFILDPTIPDSCSAIRRAGTSFVAGTTFSNLTIIPSTGYYGAGVGKHCIFIDAAGQPDYFEYNLTIDHVFCGNMKTGQSLKTFASPPAPITAGISSTTMTVSAVSSGAIFVGSNVVNSSGAVIAKVTAFGTGSGGTGTYTVTPSQTVAPGTSLTAYGNNGGGAINNSHVEHSNLMSADLVQVGDNNSIYRNTFGQGELRGDPGIRFDQVTGATSISIDKSLFANVNGMIVVDGGVSCNITHNELEMSNLANTLGVLVYIRGAVSTVLGCQIHANTISQLSTVGTIYPIQIGTAENVDISANNRIAIPSGATLHVVNGAAGANTNFNGNYCTTNGVAVDCAIGNAAASINSGKINIATANGTDPLNVGGFATISALHMPGSGGGTFTLLPPASGGGTFRFANGTTDLTLTGGPNQIMQQPTLSGPTVVSTMATTINGTSCTVGSSCVIGASATSMTVGTTTVLSGVNTRVLYDNAGVLGEYLVSGTGSVCMTTSCSMTTPALGTPSAVTLTNGSGLPISTGVSGLGSGIATWLATPSSANLLAALTTSTGTGNVVFSAGPTFTGTITASAAVFTGSVTLPSPVINGLPTGTGIATANTVSTLVARDGSGNFAAGTITAALSGNATTATTATNATNVAITDDTTTNATVYPIWVTANTGNLPQKVSSTKFSFNPSTGALSATSFSGAGTGLTGTAASFTAGTANAAPASGLTGTTLAAGVTGSSLTSVGTLTSGALGAGFTTVTAARGGTGQSSYTVGDILYADTTTSLAKLADAATGNVLLSGGAGVAPSYGKVDLAAAVTGNLPAANMDSTAWTTFTPSPACGSATFTINSARYKTWQKVTHWSMDATVSAIGTCTGGTMSFTLPNTPQSGGGGGGADNVTLGTVIGCTIVASSTTAFCLVNGSILVNSRFRVSGVYENQ